MHLKLASPSFTLPAAVLMSAVFAVAAIAQEPSTQQSPAESGHHHEEPAPKNLKVLPKTMTGEQVHKVMHGWAGALGTECSHCHAVDPTRKMPNGRPALDFAADTKPEKNTARLMYKMVEDINKNYVSMVPASNEKPEPVTCGTCHRGHVKPPEFVPPPEHERGHDHPGGEAPPATH